MFGHFWFSEKNYESMFSFVKNITNAESLPNVEIQGNDLKIFI